MNWYYKLWVGAIEKAYNNTKSIKTEKDKNFQLLMAFSLSQLFNLFFVDEVFFTFKINFSFIFVSGNAQLNFLIIALYFIAFYFLNYFLIFYKKRWMNFNIVDKEKLTASPMLLYIFVSMFSPIVFMFLLYFIKY